MDPGRPFLPYSPCLQLQCSLRMAHTAFPTLDDTIGAMLLGMAGSAIFVGLSTLQMYRYYHYYPEDCLLHKLSVAILWIFDTLHLFLIIHAVYYYTIWNFGNVLGLVKIVWSVKLQIPLDVIIVVMVQSLFALRVVRLGNIHNNNDRNFMGYLAVISVTWGCVIGIVFVFKVYSVTYFSEVPQFSWVIHCTFLTSTLIDTVIAIGMVWYLRKSKGEHYRLNSKISKLIHYTLGSGALTSACSLSCLLTYTWYPDTFYFLSISFVLTKLYVGSFFAMLNARQCAHPLTSSSEDSRANSSRAQYRFGDVKVINPFSSLRTLHPLARFSHDSRSPSRAERYPTPTLEKQPMWGLFTFGKGVPQIV